MIGARTRSPNVAAVPVVQHLNYDSDTSPTGLRFASR